MKSTNSSNRYVCEGGWILCDVYFFHFLVYFSRVFFLPPPAHYTHIVIIPCVFQYGCLHFKQGKRENLKERLELISIQSGNVQVLMSMQATWCVE